MSKTLIVEISNHEDCLIGSNEEEKYNYFLNTFMEENFDKIFASDSPLLNIINTKEQTLCKSLKQFFEYFYEDIEVIESLVSEKIQEVNEISMSAWCYGVAGILLSRIEAFKYAKDQHKIELHIDIDRCIRRLENYTEWLDSDDILCHGTLGNLDVLRHYHTRLKKTPYYDLISNEIKKKIKKNGLKGKNAPGVNNIDFMEGLSGYFYHQMREINNKMPCVLLLETF